jgi:ribosome-binding protein aMBF1 (putative translation factor)
MCEVEIYVPGKQKISIFLPLKYLNELKQFLKEHNDEPAAMPWETIAAERIAQHGKAGLALRGARFREGLSQKELAKRSGVSQENISRIENGKRILGEKVAKKLAKHLRIDYRLLLPK